MPKFWRALVLSPSGGGAYFYLQLQAKENLAASIFRVKTEAARSSETLVTYCNTTLCCNPDFNWNFYCHEKLISCLMCISEAPDMSFSLS
jgi:hypothetical protein